MTTNITPKRSAEIRKKIEGTRASLETTRKELREALDAAENDAVEAIVTGKPKPESRGKIAALQTRSAELETALSPLESALVLITSQEAEAEAAAQIEQEKTLRAEYRTAVSNLLKAVDAAFEAQRQAETIHGKFRTHSHGYLVARVHLNVSVNGPESQAAFHARLCPEFIDLLPADDLGRRRFEHHRDQDAKQREAAEKSQFKIPETVYGNTPIIPDGGRFSWMAPVSAGELAA